MVFPAAGKLFGGDNPGDGFQIPFKAPDCGTLQLSVEVDGPLGDYMKALDGSVGLTNGTYTVGDGGTLNLGARLKAFNEMSFEGGVAYSQLEKDRLYGTKLKLTGVYTYPDGSTETRKQEIYLYRWLEVIAGQDATVATGRTAAFHEKLFYGNLGEFVSYKGVDLRLPDTVTTTIDGDDPFFSNEETVQGKKAAVWRFNSSLSALESQPVQEFVQIKADGIDIGEITAYLNKGNSFSVSLNYLEVLNAGVENYYHADVVLKDRTKDGTSVRGYWAMPQNVGLSHNASGLVFSGNGNFGNIVTTS